MENEITLKKMDIVSAQEPEIDIKQLPKSIQPAHKSIGTDEQKKELPVLQQISQVKISMVRNCKSNEPKEALLLDVLSAIVKENKYAAYIAQLKKLAWKDNITAQSFKFNEIPAFIPSGLFEGGRGKEHLVNYSSILVLAIDNLGSDQLEKTFKQVIEIPFTFCAFRSPSGTGIKVFVYTDCKDPTMHEKAFNEVAHYYSSISNVDFDPKGEDYTRLCIVSSDHQGYLGEDSKQFILKEQIRNTTIKNVADVVRVADAVQRNKKSRYSFKSFHDLVEKGRTLKPKRKLFGNFILENSAVLFPSERGVGKSFLAMQLAVVISRGEKSYLNEAIELSGNVIYINLELSEDAVAMRLLNLESRFAGEPSEFKAYCLTTRHGLMALLDEIRDLCLNKKPVLLILDNLRTAFPGSDNEKNKEMTIAMGTINQLKDEIGASLLIVHHTKKGTSNKLTNSDMQSGAGALTDLVDSDFFLRKTGADKNLRLLIRKKSRDAEEQEGAKLITLNPETLWFEFLEDNVSEGKYVFAEGNSRSTEELRSEGAKLKDNGLTYAEIGRKLGRDRSSVKRWFE